jgi:dihydrofolate reductase
MWNLITLDGFFEGSVSWDLRFHESVWGGELERISIEQLGAADRLIFGRVTYEGMAAYWQTATGQVADFMNRLPKIVFSRTLERADWRNSTLVKGDAAAEVAALKRQGEGLSLVFGSADLSATLLRHGLFDEVRLIVAPVVLGDGRPLFGRGVEAKLELLESRPLSSGGVILRYQPAA